MSERGLAGVVLAGGLARRMGGRPKALLELAGEPLARRVARRLEAQVGALALNANADREALRAIVPGVPIIADPVEGFAGPLAGVLAGLIWAREHAPGARWLVSAAVDTPFFPADLAARLLAAAREQGARLAVAASEGRAQPVFCLWPLDIAGDLERALKEEGLRKIDLFTARFPLATVEFPARPFDPFFNINRPEDLSAAEKLLRNGRMSV